MYAKLIDNELHYAPINLIKDNRLIINFNKNEKLMIEEGYKEVKEIKPLIDDEQELRIASINELDDIIEVIYEVIE